MKNQNGMGHVTLILIVILIALAVGGAIYYTRISFYKESLETIKTDMLLIEGKTKILKEESNMKKDPAILKGKKMSEMLEDAIIKDFLSKGLIAEENYEKYYVLNREDLNAIELEKVQERENSYYLVNYETDDILYTAGYKTMDGKMVYKLSELEEINIDQKE